MSLKWPYIADLDNPSDNPTSQIHRKWKEEYS